MKRLLLKTLLMLFFSTFFMHTSLFSGEKKWKKVNEESNIEVFLKPSPNKMLDIMKGVGLVDGPPEKIAFILLDSTQKKNWDGLKKEKSAKKVVIKTDNLSLEFIFSSLDKRVLLTFIEAIFMPNLN